MTGSRAHGGARRVAVLSVLVLALAGCGAARGGDRSTSTDRPSNPSSTSGPPTITTTPASPSPTSSSSTSPARASSTPTNGTPPRPDHIVIVVEENHGYSEIVGNPNAPFMNRLIDDGASFTQFFAETHPSQPNYLALFSGSRQGLTDDSCPNRFEGANLATQLAQAGRRFAGYADSLPSVGFSGCRSGPYVRRHLPWTNFPAVPATATLPATSFPSDLTTLPSVSFVIPDLNHDMHDGTIAEADVWLEQKLSAYVTWARTHNSLLIVTWDEGPKTGPNRIPTFIDGAHVRAGHYNSHLDHYDLLRTIEALESLPPIGQAASAQVIRDIWTG